MYLVAGRRLPMGVWRAVAAAGHPYGHHPWTRPGGTRPRPMTHQSSCATGWPLPEGLEPHFLQQPPLQRVGPLQAAGVLQWGAGLLQGVAWGLGMQPGWLQGMGRGVGPSPDPGVPHACRAAAPGDWRCCASVIQGLTRAGPGQATLIGRC